MPLTDEQKRQLRAKMGQGVSTSPAPTSAGGLPPGIRDLVSSIPQGQPYPVQAGPSGLRFQIPPPQAEVGRQLAVQSAKQQLKAKNPTVSDAIKREFSRIDTFDGLFDDLNTLARKVRKGPIQGRYVKGASAVTGGGKIDLPGQRLDVDEDESINALSYSELRAPVAAGFYRAITGDDRISDRDAAKRAMPLVPDLALNPRAFEKRLKFVKRAVERKRRSIQKAIRLGASPPQLEETQDSGTLFQSFVSEALAEELDEE